MHSYTPHTFAFKKLDWLSEKQIQVHVGLYEGYVKHINILREQIKNLETLDAEKYAYAIMETRRRLGFEFNGMRMHEYYFSQFENPAQPLHEESRLGKALVEKYGSIENFLKHFMQVGMSRGIGWTLLYADPIVHTVHTAWIGDHELGQLGGLPIMFAMDMWEHAYMIDYLPANKKEYVETFIKNVDWGIAERRFDATQK